MSPPLQLRAPLDALSNLRIKPDNNFVVDVKEMDRCEDQSYFGGNQMSVTRQLGPVVFKGCSQLDWKRKENEDKHKRRYLRCKQTNACR